MRMEQLLMFEKVVQCGSFTKAANALYTTQPSVSKMIDALEDELGRQLLRRTSRGIELTPLGKRVYGDVQTILRLVSSWQECDPLESTVQEVHLQSTTTMCNFLAADFLLQMQKKQPDISIRLHDCRKGDVIHKMEDMGIHIGLVPISTENQADTTVTLERIRKNGWGFCTAIEDPKYVYVSAQDSLAQQQEVFAKDLARLPLGTYTDPDDVNWLLFGQYFRGDAIYRCHNKEAISQHVIQGNCATIFPQLTSQYEYFVERKMIVPIHVKDLNLGCATFLLVHQSGKSLLEAEQTVINCLKDYFKKVSFSQKP